MILPYFSQEKLKIQELEIIRQAAIIIQQGEMITRLEEAQANCDRKCKPEVLDCKPEVQETSKRALLL